MRIILSRISALISILAIWITIALPSSAADLALPISQNTRISIDIRNSRVIAKNTDGKIVNVDSSIAKHLVKSYDFRLLTQKGARTVPFFIVLVREPSRPEAMGRGYCGAGDEDYLLLVEPHNRKLFLRDILLLQSCLKDLVIYRDNGEDDPIELLIPHEDGSFSFTWETDAPDQTRHLAVRDGRFFVTSVFSAEK